MTPTTPLTAANVALASICPRTRATLAPPSANAARPRGGGPVCKWTDEGETKLCWGGTSTDRQWIVTQEWAYLVKPFGDHENHAFYNHVKSLTLDVTKNKVARSCAAGAIGGVVASAATSAGLTVVAGATGGCIAGALGYWWTK
jgi:hypothetical protein